MAGMRLAAAPRGVLLLLIIGAAATCDRQPNVPVAKPSPTVSPGFVEVGPVPVGEQVGKLQFEVSALEARVSQLESSSAAVTTEEETYAIAKTQFGPFTVSSKGVTPYLDGFKVKLSIGNLTSATFHGAKLKVSWGPDAPGLPGFKVDPVKERAFDLTTVLHPGAYSAVEVVLTPAKPEEIKSVFVGLELNQMSLRGR